MNGPGPVGRPVEGQDPVVVRRPRSAGKFSPRPQSDDGAVVRRDLLLSSRPTPGPQTNRDRVQAGDLPDWEPTPPGEQIVRRRP